MKISHRAPKLLVDLLHYKVWVHKPLGEGGWLCQVKVVTKETLNQRVVDFISRTLRSWTFIFGQMAFIAVWIAWNHFFPHWSFDDAAFNILRLVLTIEASFTGSVLLMSHHRHSEMDRKVMYNDYILDWRIFQYVKEMREEAKKNGTGTPGNH